jgi:hypothetical protein
MIWIQRPCNRLPPATRPPRLLWPSSAKHRLATQFPPFPTQCNHGSAGLVWWWQEGGSALTKKKEAAARRGPNRPHTHTDTARVQTATNPECGVCLPPPTARRASSQLKAGGGIKRPRPRQGGRSIDRWRLNAFQQQRWWWWFLCLAFRSIETTASKEERKMGRSEPHIRIDRPRVFCSQNTCAATGLMHFLIFFFSCHESPSRLIYY